MYCNNCGSPIQDDEKFCQNCGTKVLNQENNSTSSTNPNTSSSNKTSSAATDPFGNPILSNLVPDSKIFIVDTSPFGAAYEDPNKAHQKAHQAVVTQKKVNTNGFVNVVLMITIIVFGLLTLGAILTTWFIKNFAVVEWTDENGNPIILNMPTRVFNTFTNLKTVAAVLSVVIFGLIIATLRIVRAERRKVQIQHTLYSKQVVSTSKLNKHTILMLLSIITTLIIATMIVSIFSFVKSDQLYFALIADGYTPEQIITVTLSIVAEYRPIDIVITILYQFVWLIILLLIAIAYCLKNTRTTPKEDHNE